MLGPGEWLQVNVYSARGRWMIYTQLKRAGRPSSRSVGRPVYIELIDSSCSLSEALRAAADRLADLSEDPRL